MAVVETTAGTIIIFWDKIFYMNMIILEGWLAHTHRIGHFSSSLSVNYEHLQLPETVASSFSTLYECNCVCEPFHI